jgi:hypothetical protein
MPDFIRKVILYIAAYSNIMILIGVVGIVVINWEVRRAEGDNAYTQRDQLRTVSGFVKEASEITESGKRGRTRKKYYQIEVAPEGSGDALQLKIRHDVPKNWVINLIEENVTVLYGPSREVYEAAVVGKNPELTYESTRDYLIADAKATAEKVNSAGYWLLFITILGLGIGGFVFKRKLGKSSDAGEKKSNE